MSKDISFKKRRFLQEKYGNVCQICGKEIKEENLCIEHITPKFKGGTNNINNLSVACKSCNSRKGILNSYDFKLEKMIMEDEFFINLIRYENKNGVFNYDKTKNNILEKLEIIENKVSKLKEILKIIEGEFDESN
ncbi:MAG: HNH endonuclease [Clostridium sp.]|uniref:HNH endonuclease n=1 Tax=Clostridium sp. TaxID=1506 RepID=UPI003EE5168F